MKLNKFLSRIKILSRSNTKKFVRKGYIYVNNIEVTDEDHILNEGDIIHIGNEVIEVRLAVGVVLHKPAGYICSRKDEGGYKSIFQLLQDCVYQETLYVAGRLDADTEGLVYLHSDGDMIHQITNPKKQKQKEYIVHTVNGLSDIHLEKLANGIYISEQDYPDLIKDGGYTTAPAIVERIDKREIKLTITEGKYHQIKRMIESLGRNNKVIYLKRIRIDNILLGDLPIGRWKYENR